MVDDLDRCEWVNVSSGTGSPSCTWVPDVKRLFLVLLLLVGADRAVQGRTRGGDCRVSTTSRAAQV